MTRAEVLGESDGHSKNGRGKSNNLRDRRACVVFWVGSVSHACTFTSAPPLPHRLHHADRPVLARDLVGQSKMAEMGNIHSGHLRE